MKQDVNLILTGVTCTTTLTDAEAARLLDVLRAAWPAGDDMMITVTDSTAGAMPMHIRAGAIQAVTFGPIRP